MESMLSTLAFALLIGGQFLAAIVVISRRTAIYVEPDEKPRAEPDANRRAQSIRQLSEFPSTAAERKLPAKAA
jgi:hypothetical protein